MTRRACLHGLATAALVSLVLPVRHADAGGGEAVPDTIALPDGWQPEGIARGPGATLFAGSIATGAVYQADSRTGEGAVIVTPREDRAAIGLEWDRRSDNLYVAGGPTGTVFVYDASEGADVAVLQATDAAETFVNDTVVVRDAVYFTDSFRPFLYRVPLERWGRLPASPALQEIELAGDFQFVAGEFNANGIEASFDGRYLIVVNSVLGTLYRVDPDSGLASLIDLGGDTLVDGDGLLLRGRRLYVVQNSLNQIAVVQLAPGLLSGQIEEILTDARFDIPTTVAMVGRSLYAVNARFDTEPTPDTEYTIVRVPAWEPPWRSP